MRQQVAAAQEKSGLRLEVPDTRNLASRSTSRFCLLRNVSAAGPLSPKARRGRQLIFFLRGTFLPFLRALDRPMAIACSSGICPSTLAKDGDPLNAMIPMRDFDRTKVASSGSNSL